MHVKQQSRINTERGINSLLQLFAVEPTGCSIIFSFAEYGNTRATFLLPSDSIRTASLPGNAASFRAAMKAENLYVVKTTLYQAGLA